MLYATMGDHVPYPQADDMQEALTTKYSSLYVKEYVMNYAYGSGDEHAFHYWNRPNNAPNDTDGGECVSEEVINFF
jgi:hypothetical protein